MLSEKDLQQLKGLGIDVQVVEQQIKNFITGFPSMKVIKPASLNDGIYRINEEEITYHLDNFYHYLEGKKIVKFVPASGAASRMFKDLFSYLGDENPGESGSIQKFIKNINKFAFLEDLENALKSDGKNLQNLLTQENYKEIIEYVLTGKGLNYGNLPKALIKFHKYEDGNRVALEEHMVEGAVYCKQSDNKVHILFSVSPEHEELFERKIQEVRGKYENHFNVSYVISYSEQKHSTDTIAVDLENKPFREADGTILFRPGGHGALLENLDETDADIIYIKNIDNITTDSRKEDTFTYKKVLTGVFYKFQNRIFNYLEKIDDGNVPDDLLMEILSFLEKELCILPPGELKEKSKQDQLEYVRKKLNRPLRIGGMVKSEGDTGGGPFWAVNPDQSVSLQIVETPQIDLTDPGQENIFRSASHFNPNDLVLGIKDYKGNKFNLLKYRDPNAGFIAKKSKDGRDLKAQELPGLWNGSMSDWNTIFVEVPITTFTPVKMINDLLEDVHQG